MQNTTVNNQNTVNTPVAPPVPLEIEEPDEYKIKRWEELLALVKLGHENAHERWVAIEQKAMNYLTLLGIVVAAAALSGIDEVARLLIHRRDWLDLLFIVASVGVVGFASGAFGCFAWSLRMQTIMEPPLGRDLLGHVATHNYVDVLYSMSVRFVEATEQLAAGTARKTRAAAWGYRGLLVVLLCAIIGTVVSVAIKTREQMSQKPTSVSQSESPQVTPGVTPAPARPSPTSPDPTVSAPASQTFTKGIEGPRPPAPPRGERR